MKPDLTEKLLENLHEGVYYVDLLKRITFWNRGAEQISGYTRREVIGRRCADNLLRHIDECGTELCTRGCPLAVTLKDGQIREADIYLHHKDGHRVPVSVRVAPIHNDQGKLIGAMGIFADNSRRAAAIKVLDAAPEGSLLDPLIGVGNRRLAEVELQRSFYDFAAHQVPFGILFLRVTNLGAITSRWGRQTGDRVLEMVAKTACNLLRGVDTFARWGEDEFVAILPNIDQVILAEAAECLRIFVESSWLTLEGENLAGAVSVGRAMANRNDGVDSLICRAASRLDSGR
jgi:diguanylate cyclase (GGDEF)-like protein/PAS domain S-box-containing protein